MALNMSTQADKDIVEHAYSAENIHSDECPLRGIARRVPVKHVKKSLLTIYMTVMMDVFSHSSWNGW